MTLLALGSGCIDLSDEDVSQTDQSVINGTVDYDDQNRSAAVWVGGCTGALVAPDMVLTAGHCIGPAGSEASRWEDDAVVGKGTWRTLRSSIEIRVGVDPAHPIARHYARWANLPGFDDLALLLLTTPVENVRPAKIMDRAAYNQFNGLAGKVMYNPGYGSECRGWLAKRDYAYVSYLGGTPRGVNSFRGQYLAYGGPQPGIEGGDSGSPLFWWNGTEGRVYLVGIALGYGSSGTCTSIGGRAQPEYVAMFGTGAGDPAKPDISAWLDAQVTPTMRRTTFQPFGAGDRWHDWFCVNNEICGSGDFNGDGKDDIITFTRGSAGDVYVGKSYGFRTSTTSSYPQAGRGFESSLWHGSFGYNNENVGVMDIDRDGKDDVFTGSGSALWIARSTGSSFGTSYRAYTAGICDPASKTCVAGEIRRDAGGDDLLAINRTTGSAVVYRSSGSYLYADSFGTSAIAGACAAPHLCQLADMDDDGDDDLVIFSNDLYGNVDIATNLLTGFAAPTHWMTGACWNWTSTMYQSCSLGDVDGDDLPDLVIADHGASQIHVVRNGSSTIERRWHARLCAPGHICMSADFNGDGYDDVVDFARSTSSATNGDVFVQTSIATY